VTAQELEFLATTAEHKWIAPLEPDHAPSGPRVLQQQRVYLLLRCVMIAGLLAYFDPLRVAAREVEHFGTDEPVVKNDVGFVEHAQRAQRQQARIAGTCPDQSDVPILWLMWLAQTAPQFDFRCG
jgi:hypothetical protein